MPAKPAIADSVVYHRRKRWALTLTIGSRFQRRAGWNRSLKAELRSRVLSGVPAQTKLAHAETPIGANHVERGDDPFQQGRAAVGTRSVTNAPSCSRSVAVASAPAVVGPVNGWSGVPNMGSW